MDLTFNTLAAEQTYIQACVNKESWALQKLYEEYYPIMYPTCLRYANNEDDALDILHDGFIKVFNNIDRYQVGTSLGAWIKRIVINTSIDYYRKETKRRTTDLDTVNDVTNDDPDVISQLSAEELLGALQHLAPSYRSVFNLYVIEGYSHRELAEIMGITESTSRSNLVKARTKLKEIISTFYLK
ncbi:MAG TPA: RNA polymerase sigma factor [Saprospiraceae bacterium]|nr:RNA polymerase sigma factor [Saprospiraceae bacterium]